jgi:hypothetical protein
MYKKRFAKWGLHKNTRRLAAPMSTSTRKGESKTVAERQPRPSEEQSSVPPCPGISHHEGLMLMFLSSVRICSVAFFESVQGPGGLLESLQQRSQADQPWPEHTQEISFAFKLVIDLLDRGHGKLAGRMARKAFLMIEDMLTIEGPALMWNLLEMMYCMLTLCHTQLFRMLLAHLNALVRPRFPRTHPLTSMLRSLQGLVASFQRVASIPDGAVPTLSPSSSSSSPSPSTNDDRGTNTDVWLLSRALSASLERAWKLNAEILFDHFDARLFLLYCRVHWDSCSIGPPAAILVAVDHWFSNIEAQQIFSAITETYRSEATARTTHIEEGTVLQHLLTPRIDASLPQDYEMLRSSSITALREQGEAILSQGAGYTGDTLVLLRVLAGIVTAKMFEQWPVVDGSKIAGDVATKVPRSQAGHLACAIRTLMHLKVERDGEGIEEPSETVHQIRSILALCEYAHGENSPQTVRDMWLLKDALIAAGDCKEAEQVGREAFCRLEKYIQDIPVDSV